MFSFRTSHISEQMDKALIDGPVACFCTQNSWDPGKSQYIYELFKQRGNLAYLFYPAAAEFAPESNHILFDIELIRQVAAIVIDIQDVGTRYFSYSRDVFRLMSDLARLEEENIAVYIIDHLNPAGRLVEGSMPNAPFEDYMPKVAHRHGLSLAELCCIYYNEIAAKFPLHIISAYANEASRELLPWSIAPCNDMTGMFSAQIYAGAGLWNATNINPGIGTPRAYEYIGAPFIEHNRLEPIPTPESCFMRACSFVPNSGRYKSELCKGYQIILRPGYEYHSLLHGLQLMRYFKQNYKEFILEEAFAKQLADSFMLEYVNGEHDYAALREYMKAEEQKWIRKAKRFSLYDNSPIRIK